MTKKKKKKKVINEFKKLKGQSDQNDVSRGLVTGGQTKENRSSQVMQHVVGHFKNWGLDS